MEIQINHGIRTIDGKGYPVTTTRITGFQQVWWCGKLAWVSVITYHDSCEGCTTCFRFCSGPVPQDGVTQSRLPESVEARVKEVAAS